MTRKNSHAGMSKGKIAAGSLALSLIILSFLEIGLRFSGFEFHTTLHSFELGTVRGGIPSDYVGETIIKGLFERDPLTFWRAVPGKKPVNSLGFRGRELEVEKKGGVKRIACLGDSCTFSGSPPYPEIVEEALNQRRLDPDTAGLPGCEVINAGIPAFSSLQGLKLLDARVLPLKPDVVTVYFGWNDHWLARYFEDKDYKSGSESIVRIQNAFGSVKTYQLFSLLIGRLKGFSSGKAQGEQRTRPFRVEPPDYEINLKLIAEKSRLAGAKVVFITAPSGLKEGLYTDYLIEQQFVDPAIADPAEIHKKYNRIVRKVADETASALLDMEEEFGISGRGDLFTYDGIHLSQAGTDFLARRLAGLLASMTAKQ